jgi:hypothetical protein
MFSITSFLFWTQKSIKKTGVVSVQEAIEFFKMVYLYDTESLRLHKVVDVQQLKYKIEQTHDDSFWWFSKEVRDIVKKYMETYVTERLILQKIDDIERKKQKLYTFLEQTNKLFQDVHVDLIQEKLKTLSPEWAFDDIFYYFIQWHCLESQFFRDSIDPTDPLHNKNTYKHVEFQVRILMSELNGMIFDIDEMTLKEQVESFIEALWEWRFDSHRPHEDSFSDLQKEMAHVTKQWLIASCH